MATLAGQLARSARSYGAKTALIFGDAERTYKQFDDEVNQHAHALLSLGVRKGDRVAILSGNSDVFVIAMYAAFRTGAIFVPLNPRAASRELRYLLTDSGATVLLVGAGVTASVTGLADLEPIVPAVQILGLDASTGLPSIAELAADQPATDPGIDVVEDDDCMILYTSGTTGLPKGALFDHHRLLWVGHSMASLGLTAADRHLSVAPLYHCAQLVLVTLNGISMGTTQVILSGFDPVAVADALEKHRISVFLGVPTMYQLLLRMPDFTERDLSALRIGVFGAAPMPASAVELLVAALPDVDFFQLCGQTEGGPTGIYLDPEEVRARPDTTGRRAIPNSEVRVVDADDNDVAVGAVGEIIYRGETIMKEYWGKPEATAETLRDGWLRSGDLAVVDEDGYITIVDRLKDMIITGGRNVYSVEVENALAAHPDIADVAVIGRPHPTYGETIVMVVTPHEGREIALENVRAFAADYIADYKLPREVVVRAIPRNPSGKILKHVLRSELSSQ